MSSLRRILTATAFALACLPAGGAMGAQCNDCEPPPGSGGGGGGVENPTPTTTVEDGPTAPTWDNTPSFRFSSNVAYVGYRCTITKGGTTGTPYDCGTTELAGAKVTHTLPEQADGAYVLSVTACKHYTDPTDETKCDATPETWGFTVDRVKPSLTVTGPADGARRRFGPDYKLSSDSPDVAKFRCNIDGAWGDCGANVAWPAELDKEGEHFLQVQAFDHAGNPSEAVTRHWIMDRTNPVLTVTGPGPLVNAKRPTFTWKVEDLDPKYTSTCWIVGPGTSRIIDPCTTNGAWKADQDLADGEWTFIVRAFDSAGNFSGDRSTKVVVDTVAPALSAVAWDAAAERLTFTADAGALACRFDSGSEFACGESVDASQLGDGEHSFVVTLKDAAGNATTRSTTFRIGAPPQDPADPTDPADPADPADPDDGSTPPPTKDETPTTPRDTTAPGGGTKETVVVVEERHVVVPGPAVESPSATPTAKPAAKPAVKKKRCRTVTKKVGGKKRKVRVCAKKKPSRSAKQRAAAKRRG